MKPEKGTRVVRLAALLLLFAALLLPTGAKAQGGGRVVRVGWYESPFNATDELGRRSGYAYEYQQRISAFTGWTYEYVKASFPELLEMLKEGKIDLLSDVSYTEERAESILYSALPMGAEDYCLFISPNNEEITKEDYSTFNGKRVGVNKNTLQEELYRQWAEANGVDTELVELTGTEDENLEKLERHRIDMYVTLDAFSSAERTVPVCKIGSSDFYFGVSRSQPELLLELNAAMSRIQDENPYYDQQLYAKYINVTGANLYLSAEEKAWLTEHGTIRVGYQDNYLAFCARDAKTGELTGALSEYLRIASGCLENARIDFSATAYPTAAAALEAMKRGEVDCVFPANLTDYDGEVQGYYMTPPLMSTDMSAVIRASDRSSFADKTRVTVAVNAGNTNYDMFLLEHFPEWRALYFKDTAEGLQAIADEQADCLLISNFRYNNLAALCQKLDLVTLSTGVEMDYCFAVVREATTLYSILSKIACVVPAASVNSALSFYFTEDAKLSLGEIVRQNLILIVGVVSALILAFALLLWRGYRSEKKATATARLISATETDHLTGLYSKNYFKEYANRLFRENPDKPMDTVVLNIEQFHAVNAIHGREFGDLVLSELGEEIQTILKEHGGIASHSDGDHFAMYCPRLDDPGALFDRLQGGLNRLSPNAGIRLRMGVSPWQKETPPSQSLEQALIACGLAHGRFREHLIVYDDKVRARESLEQRLINDLHRAVEERELKVHYQPKYDIQSEPPRLVSAEALVRWQHPELGLIAPVEFIPLFERSGQIGDVDKYVWAEAARQIAAWRERRGVTVPVSVNLSRVDLFDAELERTLDALVEKNGLSRRDLKLEVTESACTESAYQVIGVIERLRQKGYEIEMDDFGSGYSSLNMLSAMPIDVLKMDRSFVGNMEHNRRDAQLVGLILGVARNLNIPVVAEGVENEAQLRMLRELGCPLVQGYYFSRPLSAEAFEEAILGKMT